MSHLLLIFLFFSICLSVSFSIPVSRHFSNKNKIWTAHQYKLLSPVLASSDLIKKYLHFINFAEFPSCVFILLSYSEILIILRKCCCFFLMGQCREIFAKPFFASQSFILFTGTHLQVGKYWTVIKVLLSRPNFMRAMEIAHIWTNNKHTVTKSRYLCTYTIHNNFNLLREFFLLLIIHARHLISCNIQDFRCQRSVLVISREKKISTSHYRNAHNNG